MIVPKVKITFIVAIMLCSTVFASVKVIESNAARLVLAWEMDGFDTVSVNDGLGRLRTAVSFDGGYASGDSGRVLLPVYPINAGVPLTGEIRVSVEPEELSIIRVNHPLERRGTAVDRSEWVFSSVWASNPSYNMIRDYRAAQFVVRPVRDLGQGRVQLLKRARIVIDFPAAAHSGAFWKPHGDFERMAGALLLNFNVAQGWQGSRRGLRKAADAENPHPFDFTRQRLATFRVGDGYRNESTTNENSLIKISGKRIREIFGNDVPINSVALYASVKGEMDINVPRDGTGGIPAGVFEVPLLRYDFGDIGKVDDDDYFIGYVSAASDWSSYDIFTRQFNFAINRYDDYRTYWLAVKDGAASMERFGGVSGVSPNVVENFENNVYIRTPTAISGVNASGGSNWTWKIFTASKPDTVIRLELPGFMENVAGSIQFRAGTSSGAQKITATMGSGDICTDCISNTWYNVNSWNNRDLVLRSVSLDASSHYELNALHVRYTRPISISEEAGRLEIFSSADDIPIRYRITKNGGGLAYLVRIPQDERHITLIDTIRQASYEWNDMGGIGVRYMAAFEKDIVDYSDSLKIFDGASSVSDSLWVRDLRGAGNKSDYLIITHEAFIDASRKLAGHKKRMGFSLPKIVTIGDVSAQFGGGNTDPAALRNFLYYVYRYWDGGGDALSYIVLMGSGHYDYKNITTNAVNYMPVPYISNTSCDDFYVFYDTLASPGNQHKSYYFMGRMPAKSAGEALTMVDKLIETEDPRLANFDPWRNRTLLTADDDRAGNNVDNMRHVMSSEKISRVIDRLRPDIDLRKLYLYEYEFDERRHKPGATRAFINEINNGVAVVNWFGHGAMGIIADERLFRIEDVPALHNNKRYSIFTLFSCSIGKFDHPNAESIASLLIRQSGAGAVAVMASTRDSYPNPNDALAVKFFEALFDTSQNANTSIGGALALAKENYRDDWRNNRYYVTLGDPSIRLTARNRGVELAITDTAGVKLDTLKASQQITIKGAITNAQGRDGGFGGFVNFTLFNPPQDTTERKDIPGTPVIAGDEYTLPGSPVFSAKAPVANGEFEQRLLLPMNLDFGKSGVKLIAYAWKDGDALTGAGHLGGLIFAGSESGVVSDTAGPQISVKPIWRGYDANSTNRADSMNLSKMFVKNRITAQLPLDIEIRIEAQNGINVTGTGPDEGLSMEIKGALPKRSVNHLLQFQEGSFKYGTAIVSFAENQLKSGTHELIISAQDLFGNASRLSVALDIVDPMDLKLDHVINVPNPVRMGRETRFYYHHSNVTGDLDIDVTIRIYSLGGRLLEVIRNPQNGHAWIPMDRRRNLLSPNVYLYQVTATSPNIGKTVKSKVKKLMVHPPR